MNRVFVGVGLAALAGALVFLNQSISKSGRPEHEEENKTTQSQTGMAKPKVSPVDTQAAIPPEEKLGNAATAKHHIEIGWIYDEGNLISPDTLAVPLQAIRDYVNQSQGTVSAEIVDIDIPVEDRSPDTRSITHLGVYVDGKPLFSSNLTGHSIPAEYVMQALDRTTGIQRK